MAINKNVTIASNLTVLRSGIVVYGDTVCRTYVVLDRKQCEERLEATMAEALEELGGATVAKLLTGWDRSYSGPGRGFSEDPWYQLYGRKVLVVQRCGVDV